jgi:creatinine amidohydrolase/Fe(II)-dependent formamide hydrolase-like protein
MTTEAERAELGEKGAPRISHELARLSALQLSELSKQAVIVQPIGSMEQHGAHLPVATDAFIAESLVYGSVGLLGESGPEVFILPTLHYGRSPEHVGFAGTVSLSTDTLLAICRDIGRCVAALGFRRLVFVNGHGGNVALLDVVARDIRVETGLMVFRLFPAQFGPPEGLEVPDADFAAHADFVETSVMLALDASLVRLDRAERGGEFASHLFATSQGQAPVPMAWLTRDLSTNGVIGDPRRANLEAGKRIVEYWQRRLAASYVEIAGFEFDTAR